MLRTLFLYSGLLALACTPAHAQEWMRYSAESTLFNVRIPNNVVEKRILFKSAPNIVTQTGQAIATFDQRPYKDAVKNYIVKYEQTFSQPFTDDDIALLLDNELDLYADHYSKLDGVLKKREDRLSQNGYPGGEIYIEYKDPELGLQSIRARIFFTDTTKFQQIVTGPDDIMNSFQTLKFFDTMVPKNGHKRETGLLQDSWTAFQSPLGIFTVYLPEKVEPYVPENPKVKNSDAIERISTRFYDPLWHDSVFYNVYGYKLDRKLTYLHVENTLKQKHILRHRFSADNVELSRMTNGDLPVIQTEYSIKPPEGHPYASQVKLRAEFFGDMLLVHEIIGPTRHVQSGFIDNIVKAVEFHPALKAQKAKAAP